MKVVGMMGEPERCWKNRDWADMSQDALIFAMHIFDMAKNNNFLSLYKKSFARLCETFHSKNAKKGTISFTRNVALLGCF